MVTNINQTYCDDHLAIYTNIELLCCIPETNICHYTSIKKWKVHIYFDLAIQFLEIYTTIIVTHVQNDMYANISGSIVCNNNKINLNPLCCIYKLNKM